MEQISVQKNKKEEWVAGALPEDHVNKMRLCRDFPHHSVHNHRPRRIERKHAFSPKKRVSGLLDKKDTPEPKQPSFQLMKLLPELRLMVYKEHFFRNEGPLDNESVCPAGMRCRFKPINGNVPVRMLLLASKTIYREAMPIYFRTANLYFARATSFFRFFDIIGKYQLQYVRRVTIGIKNVPTKRLFNKLFECPALDTLTLTVPCSYFTSSNVTTNPGMKHLLKLRGLRLLQLRTIRFSNRPNIWAPADDFITPLRILLEPYDEATKREREARGIVKASAVRTVFVGEDTREARRGRRAMIKNAMDA